MTSCLAVPLFFTLLMSLLVHIYRTSCAFGVFVCVLNLWRHFYRRWWPLSVHTVVQQHDLCWFQTRGPGFERRSKRWTAYVLICCLITVPPLVLFISDRTQYINRQIILPFCLAFLPYYLSYLLTLQLLSLKATCFQMTTKLFLLLALGHWRHCSTDFCKSFSCFV